MPMGCLMLRANDRPRGHLVVALLVAAVLTPAARAGDPQAELAERVLKERKIEPTSDGVRGWLRGRARVADDATALGRLVEDLGSDQFKTREAARKRLVAVGDAALARLYAARGDKDPERAGRCIEAIEQGKDRAADEAAVTWLVANAPEEGAAELVGYLPLAAGGPTEAAV